MGEITDILRQRVANLVGSIGCALGHHQWVGHPAVVASQWPAVNDAGDVVGSYIPTKFPMTRTSPGPGYPLRHPSAPVNWPKFTCYFQPTHEEHPAYTACDLCGVRL